MRVLCLDIGSKRIGLAASDPFGWTAQGLGVIERRGDGKDFPAIAAKAAELGAEVVLVGVPLDEEGNAGPEAQRVKAFAGRLAAHLESAGIGAQVELWDERYSTAVAEERLIEADVGREKRRRVIDKMAAVVILEEYLEARRGREDEEGVRG